MNPTSLRKEIRDILWMDYAERVNEKATLSTQDLNLLANEIVIKIEKMIDNEIKQYEKSGLIIQSHGMKRIKEMLSK